MPELDTPYIVGTLLRHVTDTSGQNCGAIYEDWSGPEPRHRYVLWRVWDHRSGPLVVIGLNPSTATELVLDPTLRRDIRFARDMGYGGIVKLNLFSLRSTDPSAIYGHAPNVDVATGGITNDDYLRWYTRGERAGQVVCAWGTHGAQYGRGEQVADMLVRDGATLYAFGLCANGEPKHTLYLSAALRPEVWRTPQ